MSRTDLLSRHVLLWNYRQQDETNSGLCRCGHLLRAHDGDGVYRAWAEHVDMVLDDEA